MGKDIKEDIKRVARDAEAKITESLLRWKYKKSGRRPPDDRDLDLESRRIADQAHHIISTRGRNIWNEIKKAAGKKGPEEGRED